MYKTTLLQDIKAGIAAARSQWLVAFLAYFLQLALVATIGLQVYQVFDASIGQSMELERLRTHYDHTVISDFLKIHGASITPLLGQVRWLLALWLLASVFIQGGLFSCATKPSAIMYQVNLFWQLGARFFMPFLGISIVFLLMAALIAALVLLPLISNFEACIRYFESEIPFVCMMAAAIALVAVLYMLLFAWSVYSRLEYMQEWDGVFKCIKKGWKRLRAKLGQSMWVVVFTVFLTGLATLIYTVLSGWLAGSLLALFLLQQIFVYFRIMIRMVAYGAFGERYVLHGDHYDYKNR